MSKDKANANNKEIILMLRKNIILYSWKYILIYIRYKLGIDNRIKGDNSKIYISINTYVIFI